MEVCSHADTRGRLVVFLRVSTGALWKNEKFLKKHSGRNNRGPSALRNKRECARMRAASILRCCFVV